MIILLVAYTLPLFYIGNVTSQHPINIVKMLMIFRKYERIGRCCSSISDSPQILGPWSSFNNGSSAGGGGGGQYG